MFSLAILFLKMTLISQAAIVLNQTVGSVGSDIITMREVQISSYIEKAISASDGKPIAEIKAEDASFVELVTSVLLEKAAYLEAESFSVVDVQEDELKQKQDQFEKNFGGKIFWQKLQVEDAEFKKIIERKLIAKNFIRIKSSSMTSIVSNQEALNYYEKNRLKFGDVPFGSFKENIKNYLAQQQLEERLKAWFEILKRKYHVKNFLLNQKKKS